ncbi:MAG TPA: type I-U CRISPR-associated protein Csb2 [Bryobacteraceae bacterium]|nr:type I-U CRISPR-associated protein Csb2 [Bryobacteraceae bacterium]
MFGFRITYLRGSVTAADVRTGSEKDRIEWPPHPDRLFCALAQAWGDLGQTERARAALCWLEELHQRSLPLIRCGQVLGATVRQRFVPVNDNWSPIITESKGKKKPAQPIAGTAIGRDRKPRRIPTATVSDDNVMLWWPDAEPSSEHRDNLVELARAIASLGHSSCLVAVDVLDSSPNSAVTWTPRADGPEMLRVPASGRLASLHEAYQAKRHPGISQRWKAYGPPSDDSGIARGHHQDLVMFRFASGRFSPLLEAAARVIAVWRNAILKEADQPVSEIISGHAPDSTSESPKPSQRAHLALLPLPDVGHRYARSHLLGLAAALPGPLAAEERRACLRALGRVESLTLGDLGVWGLERCDAAETRKGLLSETWREPSRIWSTVTPLVFGKYPRDLWGEQSAALIREACAISGLPEPAEVAVAPVAWILGVPPAQRFPPLASRAGKPRRAHAHVRLVFSKSVAGPVLVGAGRHQGYGLFRPLKEGPDEA